MNKSAKTTGLSLVIFFVLVWLWRFGWARWPRATDIAAGIAGGIVAVVYIWKFIILPFREGLKGPKSK
jgi:hypothetical protein